MSEKDGKNDSIDFDEDAFDAFLSSPEKTEEELLIEAALKIPKSNKVRSYTPSGPKDFGVIKTYKSSLNNLVNQNIPEEYRLEEFEAVLVAFETQKIMTAKGIKDLINFARVRTGLLHRVIESSNKAIYTIFKINNVHVLNGLLKTFNEVLENPLNSVDDTGSQFDTVLWYELMAKFLTIRNDIIQRKTELLDPSKVTEDNRTERIAFKNALESTIKQENPKKQLQGIIETVLLKYKTVDDKLVVDVIEEKCDMAFSSMLDLMEQYDESPLAKSLEEIMRSFEKKYTEPFLHGLRVSRVKKLDYILSGICYEWENDGEEFELFKYLSSCVEYYSKYNLGGEGRNVLQNAKAKILESKRNTSDEFYENLDIVFENVVEQKSENYVKKEGLSEETLGIRTQFQINILNIAGMETVDEDLIETAYSSFEIAISLGVPAEYLGRVIENLGFCKIDSMCAESYEVLTKMLIKLNSLSNGFEPTQNITITNHVLKSEYGDPISEIETNAPVNLDKPVNLFNLDKPINFVKTAKPIKAKRSYKNTALAALLMLGIGVAAYPFWGGKNDEARNNGDATFNMKDNFDKVSQKIDKKSEEESNVNKSEVKSQMISEAYKASQNASTGVFSGVKKGLRSFGSLFGIGKNKMDTDQTKKDSVKIATAVENTAKKFVKPTIVATSEVTPTNWSYEVKKGDTMINTVVPKWVEDNDFVNLKNKYPEFFAGVDYWDISTALRYQYNKTHKTTRHLDLADGEIFENLTPMDLAMMMQAPINRKHERKLLRLIKKGKISSMEELIAAADKMGATWIKNKKGRDRLNQILQEYEASRGRAENVKREITEYINIETTEEGYTTVSLKDFVAEVHDSKTSSLSDITPIVSIEDLDQGWFDMDGELDDQSVDNTNKPDLSMDFDLDEFDDEFDNDTNSIEFNEAWGNTMDDSIVITEEPLFAELNIEDEWLDIGIKFDEATDRKNLKRKEQMAKVFPHYGAKLVAETQIKVETNLKDFENINFDDLMSEWDDEITTTLS